MENKIPFTSYDFWAYLSAGFLFLFIADLVAGTGLLARDRWTVVQGVVKDEATGAAGQQREIAGIARDSRRLYPAAMRRALFLEPASPART